MTHFFLRGSTLFVGKIHKVQTQKGQKFAVYSSDVVSLTEILVVQHRGSDLRNASTEELKNTTDHLHAHTIFWNQKMGHVFPRQGM